MTSIKSLIIIQWKREIDLRAYSDRVPDELGTEFRNTEQEAVIKTNPKENERKKAKWLSKEALQIA